MRITFPMALALLFIALKLTGFIEWSWLAVLSPLWIPIAVAVVVFGVLVLVGFIVEGFRKRK